MKSPSLAGMCLLLSAPLSCAPASKVDTHQSGVRGGPSPGTTSSGGTSARTPVAGRGGATTTPPKTRPGRYIARPCRDDAIYIDAPLQVGPRWPNLNFLPPIEASLTQLAANEGWFCEANQCPSEPVRVVVRSVLGPRPNETHRGDGHLRFLRATFVGSDTGDAYALSPDGRCQAVQAVRNAFSLGGLVPPDQIYVGRECDASAQSLVGSPTQRMLSWHLQRMGLSANTEVRPPEAGSELVDLALLDSGVDAALANTLGIASSHSETGQSRPHRHGSAMAILARQLAPQAALHDVRVLSSQGSGTSASLARGLDHALYRLDSNKPLVINMSLGWPAELSQSAALVSPNCSTHEDPFGEAVRYMLDVARRVDEGPRSVAVVSASGNRPLDVPPGSYVSGAGLVHECSQQSFSGQQWFFPAQWQRTDSCRPSLTSRRLSLAAGAVDHLGQPSVVTITQGEPPLVAPGQHVMVASSAAGSSPDSCGPGAAFPSSLRLPGSFTGSSVSSALTAAAMAEAQYLLRRTGQAAWSRDGLGRLIYLTGVGMCRDTPEGIAVRQLNMARLRQALTTPSCVDLLQCAQGGSGLDVISASTLNTCATHLERCRLEELDGNGDVAPKCPYEPAKVELLPPAYAGSACVHNTASPPGFPTNACPQGQCPDAPALDRFSVGSLGPQPTVGGCPHCSAIVYPGSNELLAQLELNPELPNGTTMTEPHIRIIGILANTNGPPHKTFLPLSSVTSPSDWQPGQNIEVQLNLGGLGYDLKEELQIDLLTDLLTPGAKYTTKDVSPLIVELQ